MLSVPPYVAAVGNSSPWSGAYFCKDGRRISVGDSALFQAPGSPPFIGIIHCLTFDKEDPPKLGVTWLYRPADVKFVKGTFFDAAPNEVFYSFHKDEISAAFLLHPCKVAFLHKGVELPPSICSFECRRVYDTANKCLWWLTDNDYMNEWQEEVNQLLDKTQLEMYADGHSPKPVNTTASPQHLKASTESVLNNSGSFSSKVKGKKRERGNPQDLESIKHEWSSKIDALEHVGSENMIRLEVAKITDREGGLVNSAGVEKLVQLMQSSRKIDPELRIILVDVIAATERFDCLGKFVQLKGLPILDDWLQEAHKGKAGDSCGLKEGDKGIEELLLALLRALDKLPVNLHALQSCNIGKSVNHLRTHKNIEIHKKAKCLVDTWKKRVDAEMNNSDAKSGSTSWHGKSNLPEVSHVTNKRNGPPDVHRGPASPSATFKAVSAKSVHTDSVGRLASLSPSFAKLSVPTSTSPSTKDLNSKIAVVSVASDLPVPIVKEEKSSSSSQSQNNSQSCSGDCAKVVSSLSKEDARSSTAGSITRTSRSSRHKKSSNGYLGSGASVIVKESGAGKLGSANRNMASGKILETGITSERPDALLGDNVNNQRLVVRLPNPGRSPAQSSSRGSLEYIAVMSSQASSPCVTEKLDLDEKRLKGRGDAYRDGTAHKVNSGTSQPRKDVASGCREADKSLMVALVDEQNGNCESVGKSLGEARAPCLSAGIDKHTMMSEAKYNKSYGASLNPMNALIESCVKYSEMPASFDDDLGMNLLASVAAGEISNSEMVSPSASPVGSSPSQDVSTNCKDNSKFSSVNANSQELSQLEDPADDLHEKKEGYASSFKDRDDVESTHVVSQCALDVESSRDQIEKHVGFGEIHEPEELSVKPEIKPSESNDISSIAVPLAKPMEWPRLEENKLAPDKRRASENEGNVNNFIDADKKPKCPQTDGKVDVDNVNEKDAPNSMAMPVIQHLPLCDGHEIVHGNLNHVIKNSTEGPLCSPAGEADGPSKKTLDGLVGDSFGEKQCAAGASYLMTEISSGDAAVDHDDLEKLKTQSSEALEGKGVKEMNGSENIDRSGHQAGVNDDNADERLGKSAVVDQNESEGGRVAKSNMENQQPGASGDKSFLSPLLSSEEVVKSTGGECLESASTVAPIVEEGIGATNTASKLNFDLNEGLPIDEDQQDASISIVPISYNTINQPSTLPFSVPTASDGIGASFTVASPANGASIPPENMLSYKGDTCWKGSTAGSAFGRTEPWRVQEASVCVFDGSTPVSLVKQGCVPLDIDLNVADDVYEDGISQCFAVQSAQYEPDIKPLVNATLSSTLACSIRRLDLDLNRSEEGPETTGASSHKLAIPRSSARPPSSSGGLSNGESGPRGFDLNNGPGLEEVDPSPHYTHAKSWNSYVPSVANVRINPNLGNVPSVANVRMNTDFSRFPSSGSYPQVIHRPFVSDRVEQPCPMAATSPSIQKILGSTSGGHVAYHADIYKTPVLSSSPAISFPSPNAFPYSGFPFGGVFPLASTSFTTGSTYMESFTGRAPCFPVVQSQLGGSGAAVPSPYIRPYFVSHPDAIAMEGSWAWPRQGLDLNTGPGNNGVDSRDERFAALRQFSIANPQPPIEEQMKMHPAAGGAPLKRKEPEDGWDSERLTCYNSHHGVKRAH